jgi:DNA repair photolyase
VLVAPVIPGLDDEIPRVLAAARDAGAATAGWQLLRLPGPVAAVFEARIREALPERAERILHLVRETRGGAITDDRAGRRLRGAGPYAATIADLFRATCRRLGYAEARFEEAEHGPSTFRRPGRGVQLDLFQGGAGGPRVIE